MINSEAISKLKGILSWSDRIGSDETDAISEVIGILNNSKVKYTERDMENCFIAGGRLCFNIASDDFETFIKKFNSK